MNSGKNGTFLVPSHVYDAQLNIRSDLKVFFDSNKLSTATEFFRMSGLYHDLRTSLLPVLLPEKIASGQPLRIWSAGCSDGREPYSLAMIVKEYLAATGNEKFGRIEIRASDIAPGQIEIAKKGVYPVKQSDQIKLKAYQNYFYPDSEPNKIQMAPELKNWIDFRIEDIANHSGTGNYDIVICAHVLLYYEKYYSELIVKKLIQTVARAGYIYLEPTSFKTMRSLGMNKMKPESHFFRFANDNEIDTAGQASG